MTPTPSTGPVGLYRPIVRHPLSDLTQPVDTWNPGSMDPGAPFVYIDIASIDRDSKAIATVSHLQVADAPSRARQLVAADDVLVSTVRPNLNAVARVPETLDRAVASTGFCVLRPDAARLDSGYLYYWVRSPGFVAQMTRRATGASYPAVTDAIVKDSRLPVPPVPEQRRIAALLDKADAIRRKRQQAIRLADDLLRSAFLNMFGDIAARASRYPMGPVGAWVHARSGKSSRDVISPVATGFPVFGGNGQNGWATRPLYERPVVVVGRVGQQCGITHLTSGPAWVTDNAIVVEIVRRDLLDAVYLATAWQHSPIRATVDRLDLPFINQEMLLGFSIPLPPLAEQARFAQIRQRVLGSRTRLEEARAHDDRLFQAISRGAFPE